MIAARRATALAIVAIVAGLGVLGSPLPAVAAEYTMVSAARYVVDPDERQIAVEVAITFENTTPDPSGQFSVFEVVDLAIQEGAAEVAARDEDGALQVSTDAADGFLSVSVEPRSDVRFGDVAEFTLSYLLADGASPAIRVRPSVVTFPTWSFGTAGEVTVSLPSDVEVRVDGSALAPRRDAGELLLESGEIADPSAWLAVVTASQPAETISLDAGVPLASATVDLRVRAWADDREWGERTLSLLREALPLLEEAIGLDYPRAGPLVVVESLPVAADGGPDEPALGSGEIAVAYDEPPFTVLHQVAHVWISSQLAADLWIREGFASSAAAAVAGQLDVEPPFEPDERAEQLRQAAFPLVSWGVGDSSTEQHAWAQAAAWDVAERLTAAVGADVLRQAWRRMSDGINPYDPLGTEPLLATGVPAPPADSRRLLDQLEAVSGADLGAIFGEAVFDADAAAELPARAEARAAYAHLLEAAGEWGVPDPIRNHMAGWRFGQAQSAMAEARDWLGDRDLLLASIEEAGLTVPQRLRDRYETDGGGPEAREELEAEAAVVTAYRSVLDQQAGEPSFFERVGRLGAGDPAELLADAGTRFSQGDLRAAAGSIEAARAVLASSEVDGIVRLASAVAVLIVVGVLAASAIRRRRASRYTAAP